MPNDSWEEGRWLVDAELIGKARSLAAREIPRIFCCGRAPTPVQFALPSPTRAAPRPRGHPASRVTHQPPTSMKKKAKRKKKGGKARARKRGGAGRRPANESLEAYMKSA